MQLQCMLYVCRVGCTQVADTRVPRVRITGVKSLHVQDPYERSRLHASGQPVARVPTTTISTLARFPGD